MTHPLQTPPNWPRVAISIGAAAGTVALAGTTTPVAGASLDDTRLHALEVAIAHAARVGRPLYADAHDPDGSWHLVVYSDGQVQDCDRPDQRSRLTVLLVALFALASLVAASHGAVLVG